jgi:S-adenosylmethionine decarboxylase
MVGTEWLIDASGCSPEVLRNIDTLTSLLAKLIEESKLSVVAPPLWHQFPTPGGVTGLYLLAESHLALHTWPEYGFLSINLYCCSPRAPWPWKENLVTMLGAQYVTVRCISRGDSHALPPLPETA